MSQFIYKLNAMEHAGQQPDPHLAGYGEKRVAVLEYVQTLEQSLEAAQKDAALYRQAVNWLKRNANAEQEPNKRSAFIEAHNAILSMSGKP